MDNWITRFVAALCAAGSLGLLWTFGVFIALPWNIGRSFDLSRSEVQVTGVSLLAGIAVAWGAAHLLGIADRENNPRFYTLMVVLLIVASIAAVAGGVAWTQARIA